MAADAVPPVWRPDLTTIEGLAEGEALHPLQRAFIEHDAFHCGHCTPGQICSGVGLLGEGRANSPEDVRELMSGNICCCGAYPNIVFAILGFNRAHAIQGTSRHCIAAPPSNMCAALAVLEAVVRVTGSGGERAIPFTAFPVTHRTWTRTWKPTRSSPRSICR